MIEAEVYNNFYEGVTPECKDLVNSSSRGDFSRKCMSKAMDILGRLIGAKKAYDHPRTAILRRSSADAVMVQGEDKMEARMDKLEKAIVSALEKNNQPAPPEKVKAAPSPEEVCPYYGPLGETEGREGDESEREEGSGEEGPRDDEAEGSGNEGEQGNRNGGGEGNESEKADEEGNVMVEGDEGNDVKEEEEIVDEDNVENAETEREVDMEVDEPETTKGLKDIMVLEDRPETEEIPANERTSRRNTRRSNNWKYDGC